MVVLVGLTLRVAVVPKLVLVAVLVVQFKLAVAGVTAPVRVCVSPSVMVVAAPAFTCISGVSVMVAEVMVWQPLLGSVMISVKFPARALARLEVVAPLDQA